MSKKLKRTAALPLILVLYALIAALVVYLVSRSGAYPDGADTMFYVYRGDMLYHSILEKGNWYPLLDMMWYNGVQTLRYWSPIPVYILAGCQAAVGGSPFDGYLLFVGLLCFFSAAVWLFIGYTHDRPWIGAFLGGLWFFMPNNLFMLFAEGVVVRSLSTVILPLYVVYLHDYLMEKRWSALPKMMACFITMLMFHLGWAGMIAITTLLFLFFYRIFYRREQRGSCAAVVVGILLCFLIPGVWVVPSLLGGITGLDSSQIMANFFQSLNMTLNPFWTGTEGEINWFLGSGRAYFGLAAFVLGALGAVLGQKKAQPGFCAAILVCLLTSDAAYLFLRLLPGSQYLWMLRFISIALAFLLVSFFFWRSLKRGLAVFFALCLVLDAVPAMKLITGYGSNVEPETRYDATQEWYYIDDVKAVTRQRMALVEPLGSVIDGIYLTTGYGEDAVPSCFGAGVQAAATYTNIVQINQAAEDAGYLYLFDRCLELGNDTVLLPVREMDKGECDIDELDACAAQVGYRLVAGNAFYRVYHYDDAPETFGVISKYRAIGIGAFAPSISVAFPAVEETDSDNLNDYTYEQLSQYDVIYLSGFTYTDLEKAEELVLRLSESGVKVIVMADGMPALEQTGTQTFLGVSAYSLTISNGYPPLDTVDGTLYCDLFPDEYIDWKTVYVNGLDDVWGSFDEDGQHLEFYGTAHNENLIFIGLNLPYHYSLTRDPSVGRLLSRALTLSPTELPQRTVVPLSLDFDGKKTITIRSDYDDVDTTLARQDIFESEQAFREKNNLIYVDKGETVITLHYPYFWQGCAVSAAGVLMTAVFLTNTRRRDKKRLAAEGAAAEPAPGDGASGDEAPTQGEEAPGDDAET